MINTAVFTKIQTRTQHLLNFSNKVSQSDSKNSQEDYLIKQLVLNLEQELGKKLNINSLSSLKEQFSKI